jgi:putative ABC transport system substrate-binding protein
MRRSVIGLIITLTLAISFLVVPLAAEAPRKAMPVIGHLSFASPGYAPTAELLQGLREAGYVEGHNVAIEYRWAEGHYEQLPALARDLVEHQVDVIVAGGPQAAYAAKSATATIPIVFLVGTDPVADSLVASLAQPGGNLTGISLLAVDLVPKRLELLTELVPQAQVVALLVNPTNAYTAPMIRDVQEVARAKRVQLPILQAATASEIDAAFATLATLHADGLVIGDDPFFVLQREQIVALGWTPGHSGDLSVSGVPRGRRPDQLWTEPPGGVPARALLRGSHLARCQAGGPAGGAGDEVRASHQSQDRQGAWPHYSPDPAHAGRRGDP